MFWSVVHEETNKSNHKSCSAKKMFLKTSQNPQGNIFVRFFFLIKLQPEVCNFIWKRLWHRCFLVNFKKFLRTPFLKSTFGHCFWVHWFLRYTNIYLQATETICFHKNYWNKKSKNISMFKVNTRNTREMCKICSKLIIKTPDWSQWHRSGNFIINFEHISLLFLVYLMFSSNGQMFAG